MPFCAAQKSYDYDKEFSLGDGKPTLSLIQAFDGASDAEIQAILRGGGHDSSLWLALEKFRGEITKTVATETVFNPKHALRALEISNERYRDGQGVWRYHRTRLWDNRVFGFGGERKAFPANVFQDVSQSLWHRVKLSPAELQALDYAANHQQPIEAPRRKTTTLIHLIIITILGLFYLILLIWILSVV